MPSSGFTILVEIETDFLQTVVMSAVGTRGSYDVNLGLVDFKGGTFIGPAQLPLTSAVIMHLG